MTEDLTADPTAGPGAATRDVVSLQVVDASPANRRAALSPATSMTGTGNIDAVCGACGGVLASRLASLDVLHGGVLTCATCAALNRVPTT